MLDSLIEYAGAFLLLLLACGGFALRDARTRLAARPVRLASVPLGKSLAQTRSE